MINKIPKITYIYDRYSKASSKRKASIEMRITYERKQKYISTGIMIYPKQWKEGVVVNTPDAVYLNQMLDKMLADVRKIIFTMLENNHIDLFQIPLELEKNKKGGMTFIDYCKQKAEIRKYGKSADNQKRYDRFLDKFSAWGGIVTFNDVTENNIILYDIYLQSYQMRDNSKWHNYHRFLCSFINDAVKDGYLNSNPYNNININRGNEEHSINKYLSFEEFIRLKRAHMPTKSIEKIRDLFVFQTYTCLSYTDLKEFDPTKIVEVNGMKVYNGKRRKTDKPFTIPLLKPAINILEKYDNHLPIISNVKYNEYLKVVAQSAGIDKPISTHWARHTGATLLLNEGVDIKIVSKICGHSSIRITERIYAKLLDETIVNAVSSIKI